MAEPKKHGIIWSPQPGPQARAAVCPADFTFFGGSRGGGKSDCLLGRQIRGAEKHREKWNGLVIRRRYKEFAEIRRRVDELITAGLPAVRIGGDLQTNYIRFRNGAQVSMTAVERLEKIDDFVGHQYTEISIDECTTFPFFQKMVDKLKGSNRSPHGVPCRMFGTGNPGGPGHNEVKQFFQLGTGGVKPKTVMYDAAGESRVFVPSFLRDNQILFRNDPKYVQRLLSINDPALKKAWIDGDWDVYIGQAFLFSQEHHVIKPIWPIPEYAPLYMTFDWGYGKPFSVGWWWVDADGRVYRFAEWYGSSGVANEGLRITDTEIAREIVDREKKMDIHGRTIIRLCDPTCQNKKPDYKGGGQGPSTIDEFAQFGLFMHPGDANRKLKIRQFRERLRIPVDKRDRPMLQVYDTCKEFIRTIPALCMDDMNPEDIDCFVAGTMISTPKGDVPIEQLGIGDMVDTPIGARRILKAGCAGESSVVISNGLIGTPDHKIFIKNYGLIPLCLISSWHKPLLKADLCQFQDRFTEGLNLGEVGAEDILNAIHRTLTNLAQPYYTEPFGKMFTGRFQKDIMSIIKTMIAETTPLKIWNWFLRTIMHDNTTKKELRTVSLSTMPHGDKVIEEKELLARTLKNAVEILPKENLRALIVANILKQIIPVNDIARSVAEKLQIKKEKIARFVEKSSLQNQTIQGKLKLVATNAVGLYEKRPVYYLTVEQAHLFYANGILSANTEQEDHVYDESCHIAMARPMKLIEPVKTPKTMAEKDFAHIYASGNVNAGRRVFYVDDLAA